jgi:crotonobetainyl-CoA:carnitine CoA-transferase CaiB-like acyl-CoA transferase
MAAETSILSGIKVLDISSFIFGPGSSMIMSDFGADVIKIESPGLGDPFRHVHKAPPFMPSEFAYLWQQDNRNKRSLALDMKSPEGYEILLKLVRQANVLVTNFPPNVLERLKITYEDLKPHNEKLIFGQITGYGEKGPDANKPGFDATAYWARTGLMDIVRTAEAEPAMAGPGMGDHPSAMTMYAAIMTALYKLERTGQGSKVSSSLMANGLWAASSALSPILAGTPSAPRSSIKSPRNALLNHYQTRDERWVLVIVMMEDKNWPPFAAALGREDLLTDPRFAQRKARLANATELAATISSILGSQDYAYWEPRLLAHNVTFSVVQTLEEVADDPQALLNGMIIDVEGHKYGRGQAISSPFWVSGSEKVQAKVGPELGANGPEILRELGYDEGAISRMLSDGVIEVAKSKEMAKS